LILIGLLATLVIVMAAFAIPRRKPSVVPPLPGGFCASCGSKIPREAEICPKRGAKKIKS